MDKMERLARTQLKSGTISKGLGRHFPDLHADLGLRDTLSALRAGTGSSATNKVLIVLDQFEQWLHAKRSEEGTELTLALGQCDGERLQALLMVRDDFWMALTRFMGEMGIALKQWENFAAVDLFDLRHARKVLTAFGQAFGTLPDRLEDLTRGEKEFLDQAVNGLARDGRIISVRLALFAEMAKGKPWTPATLREVGGMEGIGVTFLEETFGSIALKAHQKSAEHVLKALLPESGTSIKGHMRSHEELMEAAGYAARPKAFGDLLHILDSETRLITPIDPEGIDTEGEERHDPEGKFYRLTHDYLVPSLREWLTRKQKEIRRGRAELLLAELASLWHAKPENRRLPSPLEWANIRLLTRKKDWNESQRRMMRKAGWVHGSRTLAALVLLGLLTWGGIEGYGTLRALSQVESLWTASTTDVPALVQQLDGYRRWAKPVLEAELARKPAPDATADAQDQLAQRQARAAVALLRWGQGEKVWNLLRHSPDPRLRSFIVNWLAPLGVDSRTIAYELAQIDQNAKPMITQGQQAMDAILFHPETSMRRALILVLGQFGEERLSAEDRKPLIDNLLALYQNDPDAGIHGVAEWTLRKWGQQESLKEKDAAMRGKEPGEHRWYVNGQGQTFAVIDGPIEFDMGSPPTDLECFDDELLHKRAIPRRFAIATKEVTVEQYQEFVKENPVYYASNNRYSPDPKGPMNGVSWYDAAAYCNWLSRKENLPECYEPNDQGQYADGMKIRADALQRTGYRLPTEAEWEYACRAGAMTSRYYGSNVDLLGWYAWYIATSPDRARPCGQLLPNELGLFDMLGNVYEWCQEQYYRYPEGEGNTTTNDMNILLSIKEQNPRILRGGSFYNLPAGVRSAFRNRDAPSNRVANYGFRPSSTYY